MSLCMVFIELYLVLNFLFFLLIKKILMCIRLFFFLFLMIVFEVFKFFFNDLLFKVILIEGMEGNFWFFKKGFNGVKEWNGFCLDVVGR